jgi:flagellin
MAALQTLQGISKNLSDTQAHVSSGLRVGSAADNAAYWSIATTMRSDNSALSAVSDALGLGSAKVDTAYSGMNAAIDVVTQIKTKLVAATEDGVDKSKVQGEIKQLQDQLKSIGDAASFSGENWLEADVSGAGGAAVSVTKNVVASFVRDGSGNVSVKKVDYTLDSSSVLFDTGATGNYGNGLLDNEARFNGTDGVAISVNVNGVATTQAVKAYSTDTLLNASPALTFQTNASGQTVALDNNGAPQYLQLSGEDKWVKLTTAQPAAGQEVAYDDGAGTSYYVDTTNQPTAVTNAAAGFSVSNLDITKLSTVRANMGGSFTDSDALNFMIQSVDSTLKQMTSAAASLGSLNSRIDTQTDFVSSLMDSIDSGVGKLVDANMEQESSKLSALQTQQQLAVQALSIANSSSQNILSLFR